MTTSYPKIKEYSGGVAILDFGPEFKPFEVLYTENLVIDGSLDNEEFWAYAAGFQPDPVEPVVIDNNAYNPNNPIKILVPDHVMNAKIENELQSGISDGSFVSATSQDAEYILRSGDLAQDLKVFNDSTTWHDSNYIFYSLRHFLLRHLKAFKPNAEYHRKYTSEVLPDASYILYDSINHSVPTSSEQLEAFLDSSKLYIVTNSHTGEKLSALTDTQVKEHFDQAKFDQNLNNHKYVSTQVSRSVWVVEEDILAMNPTAFVDTVTGYTTRPENLRQADDRGITVFFDNPPVSKKAEFTLRVFLYYTFFYYASPFSIKYAKLNDGKIIILDLDTSFNSDIRSLDVFKYTLEV
jgi:hypothetical protein